MLTERKNKILQSLVQEYVTSALPVSSETIARSCGLGISSATVRNEMVELEEEGYILQPHTSAGRIPSTHGYRHYVEIMDERELSQAEQRLIRDQFFQVGMEIEEWVRLAAAVLSRMLHNVAIVSFPGSAEPRLKLVRLISIEELIALLLLVFEDRHFRQRTVSLDKVMPQEDLDMVSRRLTDICRDSTAAEIKTREESFSPIEEKVLEIALGMMDEEKDYTLRNPYFLGISEILSQPEFIKGERTRVLMELLEGKNLLSSTMSQIAEGERVRVIIGNEHPESIMHDFSVVIGRYGLPQQASGAIGVVGPTRMPYDKVLSAIRFLSDTMSEMVEELYR